MCVCACEGGGPWCGVGEGARKRLCNQVTWAPSWDLLSLLGAEGHRDPEDQEYLWGSTGLAGWPLCGQGTVEVCDSCLWERGREKSSVTSRKPQTLGRSEGEGTADPRPGTGPGEGRRPQGSVELTGDPHLGDAARRGGFSGASRDSGFSLAGLAGALGTNGLLLVGQLSSPALRPIGR